MTGIRTETDHRSAMTLTATGLAVHRQGEGPAVGWLHGYTMDSSLWGPLWALLPGYQHLGIDLPDHGDSTARFAHRQLPEVAAEVAQVLLDNDCRQLVALSFGSLIATQLAIDAPDVVESLVLAAPTLAGRGDDPAAASRYLQLGMARSMGADPASLAELWMASPPDIFTGTLRVPAIRADIAAVVRRHRWAELADGSMAPLRRSGEHRAPDLAGITARTSVIVGEDDMPGFVANATLLGDAVPDCRVYRVPGAGHLPLLEDPAGGACLVHRALTGWPEDAPNG